MLIEALKYAAHGWPVFPCDPRSKRPLTSAGKDGSGGLKLATTAELKIREWWTMWPKAMIGIPTGAPIGAIVVDIDAGVDAKTGEVFETKDIISALEAKIGTALSTATWTVETPRGGRHLYFNLPADVEIGNRAGLIPRVDVRGTGGYVVVPPSRRVDGAAYRWMVTPWQ
jgi:putative DNA primase/helicase